MDIIAAYREAGTFRGAASIAGTTHKTVRRVIERHEACGIAPSRAARGHNYDGVTALVGPAALPPAGPPCTCCSSPGSWSTGASGFTVIKVNWCCGYASRRVRTSAPRSMAMAA